MESFFNSLGTFLSAHRLEIFCTSIAFYIYLVIKRHIEKLQNEIVQIHTLIDPSPHGQLARGEIDPDDFDDIVASKAVREMNKE